VLVLVVPEGQQLGRRLPAARRLPRAAEPAGRLRVGVWLGLGPLVQRLLLLLWLLLLLVRRLLLLLGLLRHGVVVALGQQGGDALRRCAALQLRGAGAGRLRFGRRGLQACAPPLLLLLMMIQQELLLLLLLLLLLEELLLLLQVEQLDGGGHGGGGGCRGGGHGGPAGAADALRLSQRGRPVPELLEQLAGLERVQAKRLHGQQVAGGVRAAQATQLWLELGGRAVSVHRQHLGCCGAVYHQRGRST
jgi:hypothetical protein